MVLMMRDAMTNIQKKDEEDDVDRWIVIEDDNIPPLESSEEQEQEEEEVDRRRIINPAEEDEEEEEAKVENEEIPAFALPDFLLRRGEEEGDVIVELQDVFRRILSGYSILC